MQRVERGGGGPGHAPDVSGGGGGEVLRSQRCARGFGTSLSLLAGGGGFRGSEVLTLSVLIGEGRGGRRAGNLEGPTFGDARNGFWIKTQAFRFRVKGSV